jgi:molecular chaperone GrpE
MATEHPESTPAPAGGVHPDPAGEPAVVTEADVELQGDEAPEAEVIDVVEGAIDGETDAAPEPEPDFRDLYLRALAETDNVRKRGRRDAQAAEARGKARVVRELLPALDNLDRAIAAAEAQESDEEHHMTKGIRLVQSELSAALGRVGIESFSPQGEVFDPHQHEAVAQQPVEGAASGTVVEVYQPGYRYGDEILRAAKVVVAA